ncbi:hypothetical protein HHK36_028163 [Tetracentron sinense]|uniref:Cytochrome f n=1 Tax=Tetracentron sinense TaxID=13715 RepID=A0A834YFB2_TETSI|nr:hypothetical protein HHK36_028163 [Tetracentron sinense]
MKERIGNLSFQSYRPTKKNILVIGPVPGQKYSEIAFHILSLDPATKKDVHFLKYLIYVGRNKGRGQIFPDESKSNNTVYNATAAGIVSKIVRKEKGGYEISIADASDGHQVVDIIPPGPELLVSEGESIKLDQPLTSNPNVGGFGQGDAEIVLEDPLCVQGLLFFLASVNLAQIFLVLKKKQFEKGLRFITPKAFSELLKLSREYQMLTVMKVTNFRWTRSPKPIRFCFEGLALDHEMQALKCCFLRPRMMPLLGLANLPTVERKGQGFNIRMNRRLVANAVPMLNQGLPSFHSVGSISFPLVRSEGGESRSDPRFHLDNNRKLSNVSQREGVEEEVRQARGQEELSRNRQGRRKGKGARRGRLKLQKKWSLHHIFFRKEEFGADMIEELGSTVIRGRGNV